MSLHAWSLRLSWDASLAVQIKKAGTLAAKQADMRCSCHLLRHGTPLP